MQHLQPGQIILAVAADDRVLAGEGRIADDGVESAILAREDLGKFDLPMKRRKPCSPERSCRRRRGFGKSQRGGMPEIWLSTSARAFSRALALSAAKKAETTASPITRMVETSDSRLRCRAS